MVFIDGKTCDGNIHQLWRLDMYCRDKNKNNLIKLIKCRSVVGELYVRESVCSWFHVQHHHSVYNIIIIAVVFFFFNHLFSSKSNFQCIIMSSRRSVYVPRPYSNGGNLHNISNTNLKYLMNYGPLPINATPVVNI